MGKSQPCRVATYFLAFLYALPPSTSLAVSSRNMVSASDCSAAVTVAPSASAYGLE